MSQNLTPKNRGGRPEKFRLAKAVVFQLREADPTASGADISGRLTAHAQEQGWQESDLPPAGELKASGEPREGRTLARWIKEFDGKPEVEKAAYALYSWPGSHQTGAVPWEAQRIGRFIKDLVSTEGRTPTVRVVRWAYNLTLAAPGMPWYVEPNLDKSRFCVYHVARHLAAHEAGHAGGDMGTLWHMSIPEDQQLSYVQVVDDLLTRQLWREDTPPHELEMHRGVERYGPIGIFGYGQLTSPQTLADLGHKPEEIEAIRKHELSTFDAINAHPMELHLRKWAASNVVVTDLGEKKPGEPWAYEKNQQEPPVAPAPETRQRRKK